MISDDDKTLFERADEAIAEARKLRAEIDTRIEQAGGLLQRFYWQTSEMKPAFAARELILLKESTREALQAARKRGRQRLGRLRE